MDKWRTWLPGLARKLLILVLLVTAVLLLRETGYLPGVGSRLHPGEQTNAAGNSTDTDTKPAGMAQPLAAVVCGADGGRYGAAYDAETVTAVFRRFSPDVVEALGSAEPPVEMTEPEFQDCLRRNGMLLRFYGAQPLGLLSVWLGGEMRGEAAAYRAELLCLCADGDGVALCFRTEEALYYRCATAVSQESLRTRTGEYTSNGASYAFESPLLTGSDGCAVILDGAVHAAVAQCSLPVPSGPEVDALLQAVGMNSYSARSYTEADGTVVYVGDEMTLRIAPSGQALFHRSNGAAAGAARALTGTSGLDPDVTAAVTGAWRLAEQTVGRNCGDAVLLLADLQVDAAQNKCTVSLDYAVNGVPVRLPAGHAVEVTFQDQLPVQVQLAFRRYTVTEEQDTLLPGLQAAAVAARENGTAELIYAGGGETMHCVWVKSDG